MVPTRSIPPPSVLCVPLDNILMVLDPVKIVPQALYLSTTEPRNVFLVAVDPVPTQIPPLFVNCVLQANFLLMTAAIVWLVLQVIFRLKELVRALLVLRERKR